MILEQYYSTKFKQLSRRAQNVLIGLNCSWYNIFALNKERILAAPNCGLQTADEIMEFINNIVIQHPLSAEEIENIQQKVLDDAIIENLTILSTSAKKFIAKHSIKMYSELLYVLGSTEIVPRTRQELEQYANYCKSSAERIVLLCNINRKYGHKIDNILNVYLHNSIHSQDLSEKTLKKIENVYPNYYDVICKNIETDGVCNATLGQLLCNIRNEFIKKVEDILKIEEDQIPILLKYPNLNSEEVKFIYEYKKEHDIIPVFFAMGQLLFNTLTPREHFILCEYIGFYGEAADTASIGDRLHLTSLRILQIFRSTILQLFDTSFYDLLEIDENLLFKQYPFLNYAFLSEKNTNWHIIASKERLNYSFNAFSLFCCMLQPSFNVYEFFLTSNGQISKLSCQSQFSSTDYSRTYSYNKSFIFVRNKQLAQYDFHEALYQIQIENNKHNTTLDWKRYCFKPSLWQNGIVQELVPDVMGLLAYLLNKLWGITDSDDSRYSDIEQGEKVNVREFLYEYVKAQNKPVSVDEMFLAFKEEYPSYPFTDSDQIRTYLCKDERLQPIGRSSLYVVAGSQQFKGSLQTAVIEVLKKVKDPISKEEIYKAVLSLRPDSSENSLRTILASMVKSGILQKTEDTQYFLNKKTKSK